MDPFLDSYSAIMIDGYESCKKKCMDDYCIDCGAGVHCPLLREVKNAGIEQ